MTYQDMDVEENDENISAEIQVKIDSSNGTDF